MQISDLDKSEYHSYYGRYLSKLPANTQLRAGFRSGKEDVLQFFDAIPASKLSYRYAANKWSIKEVLQHLIDTERIFAYRTFRIARRDKTPLVSFDQEIYIAPSNADEKTIHTLLLEFKTTRDASIILLDSLEDTDLCEMGTSSDNPMSARAAAFTIIGHEIWHMEIVKQKYLTQNKFS